LEGGVCVREKVLSKGKGKTQLTLLVEDLTPRSTVLAEIVDLISQKLNHVCRFEKGRWCRDSGKSCSLKILITK
jgi:hypothetical protein